MEECKRAFGSELVIVSNSCGSIDDAGGLDAQKVQNSIGIKVLVHNSKKPANPERLMEYFGCPGHELVMVGDRMLTDIAYGNSMGALTILTTRVVSLEKDNKFGIKLRRLEHVMLYLLKSYTPSHQRGNKFIRSEPI